MHELAICQSLVGQLTQLARDRHAVRVTAVVVEVGPLSGVVPALLQQAWPVARAGTVASEADLETRELPVHVRCTSCGSRSATPPNRLVCGQCGDWRTEVISGDELVLSSAELEMEQEALNV